MHKYSPQTAPIIVTRFSAKTQGVLDLSLGEPNKINL